MDAPRSLASTQGSEIRGDLVGAKGLGEGQLPPREQPPIHRVVAVLRAYSVGGYAHRYRHERQSLGPIPGDGGLDDLAILHFALLLASRLREKREPP